MSLQNDINETASTQYRSYIAQNPDEQSVGDSVLLYGQGYIEEQNATYEVQAYLPGWFAIGDDGGGRALLMRLDGSNNVYLCDHGAIGSVDPELVAPSFSAWVAEECPLPDDN